MRLGTQARSLARWRLKGGDDFQSNRFICLGMGVAKDQRESEKMNGAKQEVRSNPADGKQNVVDRENKAGYTAQDAPSMRSFHLRK